MPTAQSSEAVVLKTIEYSDTSLIVRLFTEQAGKVTVIAKGARRAKKTTAGILRPPNHIAVWYTHKEGRDIQTLTKSEYVTRYPDLSADLAKSAAAMITIEMLDRAVHDFDPHQLLFRLITATLRHLNQWAGDVAVLLHFYQLQLARQLGFALQPDSCSQCGQPLKTGQLDSMTGNLLCDRCYAGDNHRLTPPAIAYLRQLAHTHITQLGAIQPGEKGKKEVGDFLFAYLCFHVEGMSKLKSMTFWQQVQS